MSTRPAIPRALLAILALSACAAAPQRRGPRSYFFDEDEPLSRRANGGAELLLGVRSLPERTFGRVRHQGVIGMGLMVPFEYSPIALELNGSYSGDDDGGPHTASDIRARLWELGGGLRLTLGGLDSVITPYAAIGVSTLYARFDDYENDLLLDDSTVGTYVRIGIQVQVEEGGFIGIDWRGTDYGDLSLHGSNDSADYHQLTFMFGGRW